MTSSERWTAAELSSAAQALDETDAVIVHEIADFYDRHDPVPPRLVDRIRFALAWDEVQAELAELARIPDSLTATRHEPEPEQTETITFTARTLSAMIKVRREGGTVRIDGWITPPKSLQVRLRQPDGGEVTESDDSGRFSFDGTFGGLSQLVFSDGAGIVVATPVFEV